MLSINKKLIFITAILACIFSGCGEDKLLFNEKEFECKDFDGLTPQMVITGDTIKGGKVEIWAFMPGFSSNAAASVNYQWKGPNGFTATTNKFTLTNIDSADAGNYTVYAIRGNCASTSVTQTIKVIDTTSPPPPPPPINCTLPNNWANLAGVTGYENLQYSKATRFVNGGKTYIFSNGPASLPKISIAFDRTFIVPGEYTLTSDSGLMNAFVTVGSGSTFFSSKNNGRMKVTKNSATTEYTFLICDDPFARVTGPSYNFKLKFISN